LIDKHSRIKPKDYTLVETSERQNFEAYEKDLQKLKNDQDQLRISNQTMNNHSTEPKIHPKK
jgi:hypothetical protein